MSITVRITQRKTRQAAARASIERPNLQYAARNPAPVTASTTGYMALMGARHARQRARSHSQESTGMFPCHGIAAPHDGHLDLGEITDSPAGIRWMQTLANDPKISPIARAAAP